MRILSAALVLASCLVPLPALADAPTSATVATPTSSSDVTKMVTDDCARARKAGKTCVLDVPAEEVDGRTPVFSDINIVIPTDHNHDSLIRLRRDFILKILKTAEDL